MLKRILGVVCVALMAISSVPIEASVHEPAPSYIEIDSLWQNIQMINPMLSINNGNATLSGSVIGHVGVESISVTATLVRVNPNGTTTQIASWANLNGVGSVWSWQRTHFVARGHDYRLIFTVTATRNGVRETVTHSSLIVRAH